MAGRQAAHSDPAIGPMFPHETLFAYHPPTSGSFHHAMRGLHVLVTGNCSTPATSRMVWASSWLLRASCTD